MKTFDSPGTMDNPLVDDPLAKLERMYLEEYLRGKGTSLHEVRFLPDYERQQLMTEACLYASIRLTQIEQRAEFIRSIHSN